MEMNVTYSPAAKKNSPVIKDMLSYAHKVAEDPNNLGFYFREFSCEGQDARRILRQAERLEVRISCTNLDIQGFKAGASLGTIWFFFNPSDGTIAAYGLRL